MGYKICPYCGAHLDPGERCDCQDEENATSQRKEGPDDGRADQDQSTNN